MKLRSTLFTSLFAASLLLFTIPASAQDEIAAPPPTAKSQGSVSYVSGGVTLDERDAMKPLAKDYNLRMMFALNVGSYVADVKVKITTGKGKPVLDAVSDGPWMYVKLPAGSYKISAEYDGKTVSRSASVSARKGASLNFMWPGVKEKYDD
jgi:hypothetical protein